MGRSMSPPHGGVDRNQAARADFFEAESRPLTGAWIETACRRSTGTSSWSPPHGGVDRNAQEIITKAVRSRRPLTGAWIETPQAGARLRAAPGRPLTGAWIETERPRSR